MKNVRRLIKCNTRVRHPKQKIAFVNNWTKDRSAKGGDVTFLSVFIREYVIRVV